MNRDVKELRDQGFTDAEIAEILAEGDEKIAEEISEEIKKDLVESDEDADEDDEDKESC